MGGDDEQSHLFGTRSGDDTINLAAVRNRGVFLDGRGGADALTGTRFADVTLGGEGDAGDRLAGGAGDDTVWGGDGTDLIYGGPGSDRIAGEGGGADVASWLTLTVPGPGGAGVDADLQAGFSVETGLPVGTATEPGGTRDGLTGVEQLRGSPYADRLAGDGAANTLVGYAGRDTLAGRAGVDRIEGGDGGDHLSGAPGDDLLYGGAGRDRFVVARGDGSDRVYDAAAGDTIELRGFDLQAGGLEGSARQSGANTVITLGPASTLTLVGFDAGDLGIVVA